MQRRGRNRTAMSRAAAQQHFPSRQVRTGGLATGLQGGSAGRMLDLEAVSAKRMPAQFNSDEFAKRAIGRQ
jgi:predicted transcriptional regulator